MRNVVFDISGSGCLLRELQSKQGDLYADSFLEYKNKNTTREGQRWQHLHRKNVLTGPAGVAALGRHISKLLDQGAEEFAGL